jgi:hypothetical protein
VRVVQQISELVLILAERCDRQLRGHAGFFQPRIRGHKANLIDADSLRASERGLQLQRQLSWFGLAGGKGVHESAKLFFRDGSEKLHTCEPCGGEQQCELLFCGRPFQRHTIQQQLRMRRSKQKPRVRPQGDSRAQLLPGGLELFDSPGVLVAVQAGKLQEDIQASYEGASGRCFWVCFHPAPSTPRLGLPH